jgi:hypothetical protein
MSIASILRQTTEKMATRASVPQFFATDTKRFVEGNRFLETRPWQILEVTEL